jgi:hypothetical protein
MLGIPAPSTQHPLPLMYRDAKVNKRGDTLQNGVTSLAGNCQKILGMTAVKFRWCWEIIKKERSQKKNCFALVRNHPTVIMKDL